MPATVRPATQEDIPTIKELILRGLTDDPVWRYIFPSNLQPTTTAQTYIETILNQFIGADDNNWRVYVAETPKSHKVVAVAVSQTLDYDNDGQQSERVSQALKVLNVVDPPSEKVANHMAALQTAIAKCQNKLLDKHSRLVFLHAVITHPDWKREGYSKALVKHITQSAAQKDMVVASLTSPFSGYVFYSGNGFAYHGRIAVEVPGEREDLELQTMVSAAPQRPQAKKGNSFMDWTASLMGPSTPKEEKSSFEEPRRGSLLDMLGLGGRRDSSDAAAEARRKSHA